MLCQGIDGLTSSSKAQESLLFPFQLSAEEQELAAECACPCASCSGPRVSWGSSATPGMSLPAGRAGLSQTTAELTWEMSSSHPHLACGFINHPSISHEVGGFPTDPSSCLWQGGALLEGNSQTQQHSTEPLPLPGQCWQQERGCAPSGQWKT